MYALQVIPTYQVAPVFNAMPQNTGITKTKHAKDVRIHLFMKSKNKNVFARKSNHLFTRGGVYRATCHITGTIRLISVFLVHLPFNITQKLVDVYALLENRIL